MLCFLAAVSGSRLEAQVAPNAAGSTLNQAAPVALGKTVSEMSPGLMYIHEGKDHRYWFGSDGQGVYLSDGKTITHFTTKDGLCSNRIRGIQEDRSGNIYFTTYEGISKFDGRTFTTLSVSANSSPSDWKKQPDDLWFVGPPDAGIVYRYDGKWLHQLKFPSTKLGDEHLVKFPRSKFPNAIYSPYDVYSILTDSKGHVWFGTTCVGVCRFDGKSFDWITGQGLADAPVRSVIEDKKGRYWFSYSGSEPFAGFRTVDGIDKFQPGAQGTVVSAMSIVEDDEGAIWTASYDGGVRKYEGNRQIHYPIKDGNAVVTLFAIYKDRQGALWLGTHKGGAYRFNGKAFEKFKP